MWLSQWCVEWVEETRHSNYKIQKWLTVLESNISLLGSAYKSLPRSGHDEKAQKNELSSYLDVPPFRLIRKQRGNIFEE